MSKKQIPAKLKAHILARDSHCACCGTWDANHAGHIIACANGGAMEAENLLRMCEFCNTKLGNYDAEFAAYATYNESRPETETNRAKWLAYVNALRKYHDAEKNCRRGLTKRNAYKKPKPYAA